MKRSTNSESSFLSKGGQLKIFRLTPFLFLAKTTEQSSALESFQYFFACFIIREVMASLSNSSLFKALLFIRQIIKA